MFDIRKNTFKKLPACLTGYYQRDAYSKTYGYWNWGYGADVLTACCICSMEYKDDRQIII